MNRIYRSVWNEISRTFVAAAETVRGRGKPASACVDGTPAARRPVLARRRPMMLALEQRFMFDGAAAAPVAEAAAAAAAAEANAAIEHAVASAPAPVEVRAADPAKDGGKKEVVFVDTSVANYKSLEAGIRDGVAIVEIDGAKDGLAQIAKWAEANSGYDSIAILGHGSQATLHLGTTTLTSASLTSTTVQTELAEIGKSLTTDGDLMLYGCNVAKGSEGEAFIAALASATGADVAASNDATGAQAKGGDWVLEKNAGTIDAASLSVNDYGELLTVVSYDSTDLASNSGVYTKTVNSVQFTFSGADNISYNNYGLIVFPNSAGGDNATKLTIDVASGYTFDLTSFHYSTPFSDCTITLTLTYADNTTITGTLDATRTFDPTVVVGDFSVFKDALGNALPDSANDVIRVVIASTDEIGSCAFGTNTYDISNVKAPPSFSTSYWKQFYDQVGADSFDNLTGTLEATPVGTATITAYGISGSGVSTGGNTTIDGKTYDVSRACNFGTLYVNSETGDYVYDPDDAAFNSVRYAGDEWDRFTVTATDSDGLSCETTLEINIVGRNDTPEITSGATACVAENSSGTVYTATASDRDYWQAKSYSLSGTDAALFNINSSTGEVSFKTVPDYEHPSDSGSNNVYDINVIATDNGLIASGETPNNDSAPKAVQITVTDANDAPSGGNTTVQATEDTPYVFQTSDFTFTDSDAVGGANPNTFGGIELSALPTAGTLWLDLNHNGINDDAALVVGSKIGATDIAAGYLKFAPAADANGAGYANFSLKVGDGALYAATASTISIDVATVNDAPVLTAAAPALTGLSDGAVNNNGQTVADIVGLSIADVDGGSVEGIAITGLASGNGRWEYSTDLGSTWFGVDSVSETSALLLNSTDKLRFVPDGVHGTTATFTYRACDQKSSGTSRDRGDASVNGGSTAFSTASDTASITVTAVNDAPIITAPASITVTEDVASALTGISFVDSDAGSGSVTATLAVASGTLAAASASGVTVAGSGSGSLTLSGSLAEVNAFIAAGGVCFTGETNSTTPVTLIASIDDGGNTGSGGVKSDSKTTTLVVRPVNDDPTGISISKTTVSTLDSANAVVGTLSATDPDSTSWTYTILSVDGNADFMSTSVFKISGSALVATLPSSLTPTTHRVVVRATDSGGASYDQELSIKVDNALVVTTATEQAYVTGESYSDLSVGGLSLAEAIGFANAHSSVTTIRFADGLGTLAGDVALTRTLTFDFSGASAVTLSGDMVIASGATLIVKNDAGSVTLSGVISGSGALYKNGAGKLTLSGANTYTGATMIDGGELATVGDNVLADASAVFIGNVYTSKLTLGGNETIGSLNNSISNNSVIDLGAHTLTIGANDEASQFAGAITGSGNLVKIGSGDLNLAGSNTYSGTTTVNSGALRISGDASLGAGTLSLAGGTTLAVSGATTIDNAITLTGDATLTAGTTVTLSGTISGSGCALTKAGGGTLTLGATALDTIAMTRVAQGTLLVNCGLVGAVGAAAGTTVGGSGTINGTLTVDAGATLAPGVASTSNGVGTLNVRGDLVLNGTLAVEIGGNFPSSYDRVSVASSIYPGALPGSGGVSYGATSAVSVTYVGGYTGGDNVSYRLITSAATWGGTKIAGVSEGGELLSNGDYYGVSYIGSLGLPGERQHDLILTSLRPTSVTAVSATNADGAYKAGDVINLAVSFNRPVGVALTNLVKSMLKLETGTTERVAYYASGRGTNTLIFTYTVLPGDSAADLDYASTKALIANNIIHDLTTLRQAVLTLPEPGAAGSLGASKDIVIDTRAPTATIVLADDSLTIGETSQVTITFSEAVSGFTIDDLNAANGTLSAVTSSDGGTTWNATFTPSADVSDTSNVITLANAGVTDAAGNAGAGVTASANYAVLTARTLSYSATTLAESAANDGSIGSTLTITLTNETFSGADGGALGTVSNVPAGLTAQLIKVDATHARLTLSGKAGAHADAQDLNNLTVSFADGDFVGSPAAKVAGATTTLAIDFADAAVPPAPVADPVVPAPVVVTPPVVVEPPVVVLPPASVTPPASVVVATPPVPATPDPVVETVQFIAPASPLALAASPQADSSLASLAAPQLAAAAIAVAPAEAARAPMALASTGEGSSQSPAILTQGGSFQVVVVSGAVSPADGLVVNRGVADQSVGSGTVSQFAIPADAFAASSVGAVVTLSAQQSNGAPLPAWVRFDAASGRFEGQPPAGFTGELTIRVVARDAQGHEAVTTFKIKVGEKPARTLLERPGRAGLTEQLRLIGRPHPALERLARLAGWRNAA